jgi:hypothetical protein
MGDRADREKRETEREKIRETEREATLGEREKGHGMILTVG